MNSKARVSLWERIRRRHKDAPQFTSVRAALFSYEMGRTRWYLPKMTLIFWVLGVALYWVITMGLSDPAMQASWRAHAFFFSTQVLPSLALLLPALSWQFVMEWCPRKKKEKKRRRLDWTARIPVTKQEQARARILAAAVNLGVTLVGIAALNVLSFLLADHAAAAGLLGDAWRHGETSLREVVMICLGPSLVTGLLAWIAMTNVAGILGLYMVTLLGFHCMVMPAVCTGRDCSCGPFEMALLVSATWFSLLHPTIFTASLLIVTARHNMISRRAAWLSTALWVLLALALYPLAQLSRPSWSVHWVNPAGLAIACLCLSEWLVLGWVTIVFRRRGYEMWAVPRENPAQHERFKVPHATFHQLGCAAAVLLIAAFWSWLQWPVEPAVKTTLRSQGLPADSKELDRWYATVPPEENLALKYQAAWCTEFCQYNTWIKFLNDKAGAPATPERKALEDNVLVCGKTNVGRTQPIPPEVWAATQDYWNIVGRPVAEMLHETARSGLWKSRYPLHLERGFAEEFAHLDPLRRQANILAVEAWVSAVNHSPDNAVNAICDTFPIANSLCNEPMVYSQRVRMLIMGTAVRSLENVANRMDLSASQLGRLQETLANALPPSWEGPLTNRALAGERAMSLDYAGEYYMLLPEAWEAEPPEGVIPAISTAFPLLNLLGGNRFERAAFAGYYRLLQRITDEAVRTRNPTGVKCAERLKQDAHRSFLMPMADTFLPDFGFVIESELRIRTQLDLARTALAVERFRLANGRLPERLEDVVSAFLDRVPVDPWNGGKLVSYCVKENGEFVVYSYGKNKTDEKGEEMRDWWDKGDITFTVAPVAVRRQLQVAGAA